jgi:hypothetical protein
MRGASKRSAPTQSRSPVAQDRGRAARLGAQVALLSFSPFGIPDLVRVVIEHPRGT